MNEILVETANDPMKMTASSVVEISCNNAKEAGMWRLRQVFEQGNKCSAVGWKTTRKLYTGTRWSEYQEKKGQNTGVFLVGAARKENS